MAVRICWPVLPCLLVACGGSGDVPSGARDAALVDAEPEVATDSAAPTEDADTEPPEIMPDTPDAPITAPPTILSLNLHCLKNDGTAFTTTAARFAAIADFAAKEEVSAIAVQEACVRGDEDAMKLLASELARATGVTWSSTWAFAHKAWEGTADESQEGVGVLARGALTSEDTIIHRVQSALVRVAVSAVLPSGVRLYSVHFDHSDVAARTAQARELAVAALVDSDPGFDAIVAGDFNARPGRDAHAAMLSFGFRDLSAPLDGNRIDHVVTPRASAWTASAARLVLDGKDGPRVSDHPGVLVKLARGDKPAATITRITARASLPVGDWLALRGGALPLDWMVGWPARATTDGFRVVLTEWSGAPVEVKLLRDDKAWMVGDNAKVTPGTDVALEPKF